MKKNENQIALTDTQKDNEKPHHCLEQSGPFKFLYLTLSNLHDRSGRKKLATQF
jgi:hypothetical protein